jgi:hypothetical protein
MEEKTMRQPTFETIGPLDYTPTLARALEAAGWVAERKRGEPVWWRDPMGLVPERLRTGEAWQLLMKRKASGVQSKAAVPREHPEDRKIRLEGEVYGKKHAADFCADQSVTLADIVGTYGDLDSHAMLDELRERFWSNEWLPRGKK